ncbi:copper resistance protein NlpE [Sphingobacterium deserti]|uniref:Copper resistance lipoprotein NlpE n=1 Tax=Sphingobacterium deserti TaxID=1229276 RepID=A0A0B8T853_9SPHI|nr:copper resistance protein NlpE [Sphingobacterium deserti]KGE14799.1 copper resistance lipoprotein NlpE [Sphingobacterium deserti]
MKKLLGLVMVCVSFISCGGSTSTDSTKTTDTVAVAPQAASAHNSQNSLDWPGTYEATLPCADCPGIKTRIVINEDESFQITSDYLERNLKTEDSGRIMWHDNGSVIHLKGKDSDLKLKVGENQLFQLDQDGKVIEGELAAHYIYKKKV